MSLNLNELKALHDRGLALIYLHPRQKRPIENGWTTGPRKTWAELKRDFNPSYNVGVRLGEPSKIEGQGCLCCIDVDIKDPAYKTEALQRLKEITKNDIYPTVLSGSGSGSCHLYAVSVHPFKMVEIEKHKDQWEICAYSTGRQMVLPPSVHPNGKIYKWKDRPFASTLPLFNPEHFVGVKNAKRSQKGREDIGEVCAFIAQDVDLYSSKLDIPTIKQIIDGEGVTDRSASLMSIAMKMCRKRFTDDEILSVLSDENNWIAGAAFDHTQSRDRGRAVRWLRRYTLEKARYETDPLRLFEGKPDYTKRPALTPRKVEKLQEQIKSEIAWQADLQRTDKGGYKQSLTNIELILSNVGGQKILVHDDFSVRDSYGMDAPWGGKKGDSLGDIDIIKIRRWLSGSSFKIEPGRDLTIDAVKLIADRNRHHPVREWLKSLEWDGTPRIDSWIKTYLRGRAPEPYLTEISRIFLLAMVKRVFEPGCQWDYTLVFEGAQGTYKSSTARALAGDAWFMDNLPDLRDKDVMLNLQGKWVIELGELADVKRGDYNLVKAYLNRRVDTVRSPYDRLKQDIPRQSVFIGTVNEGEYLKDPTGNRRFWPVRVGTCDVEAVKENRDQLFAEAVYVYENFFNGKLMLSEQATVQATKMQDDRRVSDESTEMEDKLYEFVVAQMKKSKSHRFNFAEFKMRQLFEHLDCWHQWSGQKYMQQVGSQVLHQSGFVRRKVMGQRVWKYRGMGGMGLGKILKRRHF